MSKSGALLRLYLLTTLLTALALMTCEPTTRTSHQNTVTWFSNGHMHTKQHPFNKHNTVGKQTSRLSIFKTTNLHSHYFWPASVVVSPLLLRTGRRPLPVKPETKNQVTIEENFPQRIWQIWWLQQRSIHINIISEYLRRFQYQHLCPRHSWFFANRRQTFPSVVWA